MLYRNYQLDKTHAIKFRKAEGYPATLSHCKSAPIRDLKIYGNSYQATRGKNLFDLSRLPSNDSGGYIEDDTIYVTGYPYHTMITPEQFLEMTGLQEGDTFTTTCEYTQLGDTTSTLWGSITFLSKTSGYSNVNLLSKGRSATTIIPEGFTSTNYNTLYIYSGQAPEEGNIRGILRNVAIYKGAYTADTMPEYEPYVEISPDHPSEIQCVGDLTANLFNIADRTEIKPAFSAKANKQNFNNNVIIGIATNGYTSSGSIKDYTITENSLTFTGNAGYGIGFDFDVVAGEKYSVKCNANNPSNVIVAFVYYDSDGNYVNKDGGSVVTFKTTTIPSGVVKMVLIIRPNTVGTTINVSNIMLVNGAYTSDTMPEYEPYHKYDIPIVVNDTTTHIYLDEPLRKVGDYADYIDFKNQKVMRNIFKQSLLANSIYKKLADVIRIDGYIAGSIKAKSDTHMLSPMFKYKYAWTENIESVFHHNKTNRNYYWSVYWSRLGLTYDGTNVYRTDDIEQNPLTNTEILHIARDWLSTLSEEDKEVYMILDSPIETSITVPRIKLHKGTNILSTNTAISPSNLAVKYVRT